MDIIQLEELHILIPQKEWLSHSEEISKLLTGYSNPKMVQLFTKVIEKRFLDEKLLLKLFIAKKNNFPLDFYYEILEKHEGDYYRPFAPHEQLVSLRFSLLQQQLLGVREVNSLSQVYHLVFLDEDVRKIFLNQNLKDYCVIHFENKSKFVNEIPKLIKSNKIILVIWDDLPSESDNALIKQYDFWMKIIFNHKREDQEYSELTILNSLETAPVFKNMTDILGRSGILFRYYGESDDQRFISDLIHKKIIPEYYENLFMNSYFAYPREWISLIKDRRFLLDGLALIESFSSFLSIKKLKNLLLNNEFEDITIAFDLIKPLMDNKKYYAPSLLYKFLKKQKVQKFKQIQSALFLLQNKKYISKVPYLKQEEIQHWASENDESWQWIVPLNSDELFYWGFKLDNCLNRTDFHQEMLQQSSYILIGQNKQNKKYHVCISFHLDTGVIKELRKDSNVKPSIELESEIQNKINMLFDKTFK